MNDSDLLEEVRENVANVFGVDESDLPEDASRENYAGWTSLMHLTLLATLEEQFSVTFSIEEMEEMTNLSKIVAVLKQHGK